MYHNSTHSKGKVAKRKLNNKKFGWTKRCLKPKGWASRIPQHGCNTLQVLNMDCNNQRRKAQEFQKIKEMKAEILLY